MDKKYLLTLDYLFQQLPMFQRVGSIAMKKDLTNIRAMCEILGQPQSNFRTIHIAGTNGKGSVAHMLAAICTAGGLKVGLYTSPHYKDFRERIKINGQLIPKETVIDFVEQYQSIFQEIRPSFFEWSVALAFDYFSRQKVDLAIIETGLGGRLDSTNVIKPELSIITNIGFDHQQFLGDTLEKIAEEKAGIIKPNTPVVIGETHPETKNVFIRFSEQNNAPIYFADQELSVKEVDKSEEHTHYEVTKINGELLKKLSLQSFAPYHKYNLPSVLVSIQIMDQLHPNLINDSKKAIEIGLKNLKSLSSYQGRWEVLGRSPFIICDSAHNAEGIEIALKEIAQYNYQHLHIVLGMVNDKSHYNILNYFPKSATYYFAKAAIPRGLESDKLQLLAESFGLDGKAYFSVQDAFEAAKMAAGKEDLIFVGGSIFVVAEIL